MELSLKNYTRILPKELLKKAEKNIVRECDEIEKGHFQAYVDEGDNSFDVSFNINGEGVITVHSCDCNSKTSFCRHKSAFLLFLAKGKKSSGPIKKSKKTNPSDILVDEVEPEKLKDWVKDILVKNKDLELAFVHQFSSQQKIFTPADIKKNTVDAVRAVVKRKVKLEVGEVKKIVDLWTELHADVITQYINHVTDENAFLNFNALLEACEKTKLDIITGSNKFDKYMENVLAKAVAPIHNLLDESVWDHSIGFVIDRIQGAYSTIRTSYLFLLSNLFDVSTMDRKKRLTATLAKQYGSTRLNGLYNVEIYTDLILRMVKETDLFADFNTLFKPAKFRNSYNVELIELLIKHRQLKLAEKYCEEQIQGNYRSEYNLPYLQLLKQIYTVLNDNHKLSFVLKELFPMEFDFDDYLFITAQIKDEDEKKKWRTKTLTRARHMSSQNTYAQTFTFNLMAYEKNYKKMVDYIDVYTPYSLINRYATQIALAAKMDFLQRLVNIDQNYWFSTEKPSENENVIFPELLGTLLKHYPAAEIKKSIATAERLWGVHRMNRFTSFIKKNLN